MTDPRAADLSPAGDPAWREAMLQSGVAAALIDGAGRIEWCSPPFTRLCCPGEACAGRPLLAALGAQAAPLLEGAASLELSLAAPPGADTHWRARLAPLAAPWRLLTLHAQDDAAQLRARVTQLEERLDLIQEMCNAGFFERDPVTLEGQWDAQMYRIFGLPAPPPGTPAPGYDETAARIVPEDRRLDRLRATAGSPGKHADRFRIVRPDGSVRHVHSRWRVIHDAEGRPARVLGVDIDDTEEVELAQRALRLSEDLDAVLRLGNIAVWRRDLASGRVFLDEHGYRLSGLAPRPEGMTPEEARSVLHPDDVAKVEASAVETLRTGEPTDMTLRYRRPEGGWRHVLSRRALLRDAAGKPVAFIGVLLDETERVAQARQGQEMAQRLEAAAEAARIGLWSARDGDERPAWNRRMFDLLGLAPDQPSLRLGEWLRRCVHADDRQRAAARLVPWARSGSGPIEVEFRCVIDDGAAERWLVARGAVEIDEASGERRIEGVLIDITEHKHALVRLREAAERVELASAAVGLGVWEIPGLGQTPRWDANMFRLRGVESGPREVTPEEIASFLDPGERDAVMAEQVAWVGSGLPWRRELRIRRRDDGRTRWIASWSSPVLDADGRELRRIGLNWDITEVREAEQALRERERAVAESRAKSRLMSRVSHELRTPLNAVLGFTQLLREGAAGADDERRARWLEHIDGAGRHLLLLIDDVLDLSRADAGELRLNLQPVVLHDTVRAALPMLAAGARERGVELIEPEHLPGIVSADPVRLRQVLLNLLSNAIKYNRPGGRVWLESAVVDGGVRLSICDSGRGIAPERLHDVFEPFNRLGAEASNVEGTGIGLAIVKALVEAMHGSVAVRSRPGEGTVFDVTLAQASGPPAAPDEAAAAPSAPAQAPGAAGARRVLYVEDDEINALLVHELLAARDGIVLDEAATGADGLAKARALCPDLILLDMQLPDMDGLAVLRALRSDPATAAIPCVALSANAMPQDIEAARAAGFDDYWTKPIDFAAFLGGIERMLARAG